MEQIDFQNLLIAVMSQDQNQMASKRIQNLIETNYPLYLELLIDSIQRNNNNDRVFNMSITLLHVEVKSKRIFADPDFAIKIVQDLTPIIADILQSPNFQDNFKEIMAYILAQLHIFVYHFNNNVDIPTYLLSTFNQMPGIRKYLIYCIFEISFNDEEFGGFSIQDLVTIITHNLDDPSLYIPILKLFFAIAMRQPGITDLHTIFAQLFAICPEIDLNQMLIVLSDFAEHSSLFFFPCLGHITQQLCAIAANIQLPPIIRNNAMICLSSISKGAPEMCQSTQEYYVPVFQTLVRIASEITDDSPWEFDPNNTDTYQCALDSIDQVFEKYDNSNVFIPIYQIIMTVLSDPNITWQTAYAAISSLAEINLISISYLLDVENLEMQKSLFNKLAMFLNIEAHPRARTAVYTLVSRFSSYGLLSPSLDANKILIVPLETLMIIENTPIAKKMAYQAFTSFISQPTAHKASEYFLRVFPSIIEELRKPSNEYFKIYILRLLGPLIKSAREDAEQYFPVICKIAIISMKTRDYNVRAESIQLFSLALSYVKINDKLKILCAQFCQAGINLLDSDLDEDSLDHVYDAIHELLILIDNLIVPLVPQLLPKIITDASKAITIDMVNAFESNDVYKVSSLYLRIPSPDINTKQYAPKNEVTEVRHALLILDALISSDPNFATYMNDVYSICQNWILNQFHIEPLKELCWVIFDSMIDIFYDKVVNTKKIIDKKIKLQELVEPEEQQILTDLFLQSQNHVGIIFHCYINSINQHGSPIFMSKVFNVAMKTISLAILVEWFNLEIFTQVLQTLPPLIDYLISVKSKKLKDMVDFNTVDLSNKSLAHCDICLNQITNIISQAFKLQPEITYDFYNQTIAPKTADYLNNELTLVFGISTTTLFIIQTKNKQQMLEFCELLIKYAWLLDKRDNDLSLISLSSLGKLFYEFPLDTLEIAQHYMQFFIQFFNSDQTTDVNTDEMIMVSDFANVSFAKFLHVNKDFFEHGDVIYYFLEASPLWESVEDSDYYFAFMAEILELGWFKEIYQNDWPDIILGHILSGFLNDMYEEPTRIKFAKFILNYMNTPEGKKAIDSFLVRTCPSRRDCFRKLIDINE